MLEKSGNALGDKDMSVESNKLKERRLILMNKSEDHDNDPLGDDKEGESTRIARKKSRRDTSTSDECRPQEC